MRISKSVKLLASKKRSRKSNARRSKHEGALTFEKLEARNLLTGSVVINELMYNPVEGSALEFVELYNQLAVDVDVSRWSLDDGVDFEIPQGTVIGGGEFLLIAADVQAFAATGVAGALGPYTGQASNSGETIELRDQNDRLIDQLDYSDSGLWPVAADGSGASLSKIQTNLASDDPASWAASSVVGGTPGFENTFVSDLPAINEIQAVTGNYQIEIYNGAAQAINLSSYVLTQSGGFNHEVTLTGSIPVAANGYHTISAHALGFTPAVGEKLFLSTPGQIEVADAAKVTDTLMARATAGNGLFQIPNQATLGSANTFSFHDEIVINEIQYHHAPQFGSAGQATTSEQITPVTFDSVWRFNESGSNLGTNWAQSAHAVGGDWSQGAGVVAYETGSLPLPINTVLSNPATNSPFVTTHYFETEFSLTSDQLTNLTDITLSHLVDDGAVFYINGVEFDRYKINAGPVQSSTLANAAGEAVLTQGVTIPIATLVVGVNRLSVEVHQASITSSDVVMGVAVEATIQIAPSTSVPYADNSLEWIELHNRSNLAVNIAGWELDQAVDFEFPLSTSIAAGGYLVVTNDRNAFLAEYPAINPATVLGDFGGKLSNQSERIVLLDSIGNTADEVTYFDGGRWAGAADGGGSTLELIDSDSNNSVAEAWAASDETSKSPWVTYTYTGTAGVQNANNYPDPTNANGGSGNQTTEFNEFIFGLLDSGEVLLDDLSVIDLSNGSELLQDGTFEFNNSTSSDPRLSVETYRVLGTHGSHGLTGVAIDPDDSSNSVLRLVATGGADHVYNHVETTFANNAPIVDGRAYQISFRAKWISGSPLFNTRLYFNKVAQTTTLETPGAAGTPGAANSVAAVNAGPTFTNFEQSIAVPGIGQSVQISAAANDNDGIASMTLFWSVDEGSYQAAAMNLNSDGQYVANIPGQALDSVVQFFVLAADSLGATSTYPAQGADSRALFKVSDVTTAVPGSEVVIDDFNAGLSNWNSTTILDDNGGGSNTSTWTTNGSGQLELETTAYDGIEQHAFIYDGLSLGVGQEIKLDLALPISGNRNLGLYVGGTAPAEGVRQDYITVYGESNSLLASRGFDGTSEYNSANTIANGATQVFIAQIVNNVFEIGYYNSAGARFVTATRNPSFANDANFVGIYADVRATGTISFADDLTLETYAIAGTGGGTATATPTGAPSFRIIMTEADRTFLHDNTNVSSNDGILATVVYNNTEVYHNVEVRLKSSLRGRWDDTRLGFKVKFDPTHLFNGLHKTVDIDRSGAGRGSPTDYFGQAEIISWHILNQAGGVPGFQNDFVYFEQPRAGTGEGTFTEGSAQLVFTAYRSNYLDSAYEDGSDGKLFKFASIYATDMEHTVNGDPEGFKTNGRRFNQVYTTPLQDLGDDPEAYRYNYLIQNNEAENDLSPVIELAKTFSLSQAQFNTVIDDVIDVDQFLRTSAAMSLLGAGDNYFSGTNNNLQLYQRPSDGKFEFFPWDNDTQRGVNTSASLVGNSDIQKVINVSSTNLRNYYSHLNDIMNSTFNTSYMAAWTAHYESFTSLDQDFGENLSFIGSRNAYVTNQLNSIVSANTGFAITTNGGANIVTGQNTVTIEGTGNLDVNQIRLNGSDQTLDVTWTSNSTWEVTVAVAFGANVLTFEATRFNGDLVASDTITVISTSSLRPQQDFLRITEFHYNPPGSTDATEFIELTNVGTATLNVSGAIISEGPSVQFVVPNGTSLAAGQSLIIAGDLVAFEAAYPQVNSALLFGPYVGGLSNKGETLTLQDSDAVEIMSVSYEDGDLWSPLADGEGASLELIDPLTSTAELDKYYSWRASAVAGGTPGTLGSGSSGVVINEILAHTDAPDSDTIELFNNSNAAVDISGWWLSDSTNVPLKYEIPAGTILAAGGFITFDESDFNPTPLSPGVNDFALSASGDQVILSQGSGTTATRFEDMVDFGATFNGESLGRLPNGTGRLTRLASTSLGAANGVADVGPLVISEVNYHPDTPTAAALAIEPLLTDDDLEYIEVANPTGSAIDLAHWRIRGEADFEFAAGTTLAAGQAILVVSFDPALEPNKLAALVAHYSLPSGVTIVGGLSASLSNSTGRIALQQPGTPDALGVIPHVAVDEIVYDDLAPWPDADGSGQSLQRDDIYASGNFATSWTAAAPTPGIFESQFLLGDSNQDGIVNFLDIAPFIALLQTQSFLDEADINRDGQVDFLDINPFINLLSSGN